jgi:hypothetical protein
MCFSFVESGSRISEFPEPIRTEYKLDKPLVKKISKKGLNTYTTIKIGL